MPQDGTTKYDVHAAQFSFEEACEALGETKATLDNWERYGHFRADQYVRGARNTPHRRYSIIGIARASLIASLVRNAGLEPSDATQIAEFCAPLINEHFDRDILGEPVSNTLRMVVSQRQPDGRWRSWACYRRQAEHHFYLEDPNINPQATAYGFPVDGPSIVTPLSELFFKVFLACTDLLARQERGAVEFGLPGLVFADTTKMQLVGLTLEETREFRRYLRTSDPHKLRHHKRYLELYDKYARAATAAALSNA